MKSKLTTKDAEETESQPPCLGAVMPSFICKTGINKIEKIYFIQQSDCVVENNVIVRLKRKYGKFKREVVVQNFNDGNVNKLK